MNRSTKLSFFFCLTLTASAISHAAFSATLDERISTRLDALEKENATLRARINRLETSKAPKSHLADTEQNRAFTSTPRPQNADAMAADLSHAVAPRNLSSPHFEVSGSLLFLQSGAGNLEYATLVTPLPVATPSWSNQSLKPNFSPAFDVGARYIVNATNDIALNWTHLNNTANASVVAAPTQMLGPPYLIGPESALYKIAHGTVQSTYDSVKLDGVTPFATNALSNFERSAAWNLPASAKI
jgi:hypothetical protein